MNCNENFIDNTEKNKLDCEVRNTKGSWMWKNKYGLQM